MNADQINRILDVIEKDIVPKTIEEVRSGSKLFGAAVLRKSDLSVVVASTNQEKDNPLYHGEVSAINDFYSLKSRPATKDCLFIATHEPCSLCLSAITWSGFDNFSYLFSYEDSRDQFSIPYDIDILQEVYRVADPGRAIDPERPLYNKKNKFFISTSIKRRIKELNNAKLGERVLAIEKKYNDISGIYQSQKGGLLNP